MPSSKFNASDAGDKSPSICKTPKPPLIPIIPGAPPPNIHGWAHAADITPVDPLNVAMYIPMKAIGAGYNFTGSRTVSGVTLALSLTRVLDPQPYLIRLDIQIPGDPPAFWSWYPIVVKWEPPFDSGLLTHIYVPNYDYQEARVTA